MTVDNNVYPTKEDLGKNLYRKKTYYTLMIEQEQEVLADNEADADHKFLDFGGIKHSAINKDIVDSSDGVETYVVDANYSDSGDTEYVAKVVYDLSDPYAKEEGYVELDSDADEKEVRV